MSTLSLTEVWLILKANAKTITWTIHCKHQLHFTGCLAPSVSASCACQSCAHTHFLMQWGITTVIFALWALASVSSPNQGGLDNLAKALASFPNRLIVFLAIRLVSLKCVCHLCRFQQFFYIMLTKLISMMYIVLVIQRPVLGWLYSVPMFCFDPQFELFKVTIWNILFTLK